MRAKKEFLIFGSPLIEEAEIEEVVASLRSGWLGTGPKVARFEQNFAAYKGVKHAVALNSCTAALHLRLESAQEGKVQISITSGYRSLPPIMVACPRSSFRDRLAG